MNQPKQKPKGYPAKTSGGLWSQNKEKETWPDLKGSIEITQTQMQQLIQLGKLGQEPKLQLACWIKQDGNGQTWYSLGADVYVKDETQQPLTPAPAQAPVAPAPVAPPPMPSFDDFGDDGTF